MRFTSHRDFARAFERAVRRAGIPIAYSQGFTPHPKISYASASPTGVASEAEFLELGLQAEVEPEQLRAALDAALSPGLDVLDAATAAGAASLADLIDASLWRIELPEVEPARLSAAVDAFLATEEIMVERLTKQGRRRFDTRAAVVQARVADTTLDAAGLPPAAKGQPCAILEIVVRQVTPTVRPDDVLAGLRVVADLDPPVPARATRLAQGRLTAHGDIVDPLVAGDTGPNGSAPIGDVPTSELTEMDG